jgi:hypothetical protein
MTERQRGPAITPGPVNASATTKRHHDHGSRPAEVVARGFYGPPAGRRALGAIVVPIGPFCGHLHLHRSTGPHGGRRRGSCGTEYVIRLAGYRRGRWAR